jgi:hypothetical protein
MADTFFDASRIMDSYKRLFAANDPGRKFCLCNDPHLTPVLNKMEAMWKTKNPHMTIIWRWIGHRMNQRTARMVSI